MLTIKTRRGKLDFAELRALWRRFGHYVFPHWAPLLGALAAGIGVVAMQLASPWPIKIIFDYIIPSGAAKQDQGLGWLTRLADTPMELLAWVCGAILLIAVLDGLFSYAREVLLAGVGQKIVARVRQHLFAHLQKLPPAEFERRNTGALMTRLSGDIQLLRQLLVGSIVGASQNVLTVAAMLGVMLWLNPQLTALGLVTVPVTVFASWRISKRIRQATEKQREKEDEVASIAQDVLGAMAIVQAFNRERIEQKRFARENRSTTRAGLKTTRLQAKLYRIVALASAAAVCVIVYAGVRAVLNGVMTAGDLLVFVSYLRAVNKPVRDVAKLTGTTAKAVACGKRIAELFAIQPRIQSRPGAVDLHKVRGEIALEGVDFSYDGRSAVLSGINLSLGPGERVAIVGQTGAGKSTLVKLLLRFHDPQSGTVRIDGFDIRDVTTESLRRQIGWVHQDTILFGMSVAENIALGRPDADLALIRAYAQRTRADEFIQELPDGYQTILGQNGITLSGGQRQRIALARALLREPGILLLDEPATGLDALTRKVVEEAWLSAVNTATTIVICHRLAAMERFHRIILLANGRIAATGTHDELLRSSPEYARLVDAGTDSPPILRITEKTA